jgi:hypothetical protein
MFCMDGSSLRKDLEQHRAGKLIVFENDELELDAVLPTVVEGSRGKALRAGAVSRGCAAI